MAKSDVQKALKKLKAEPQKRKNKKVIAKLSENLNPTKKGKK